MPVVKSSRTTGSRPLNGSSRISRRGRGASASRHCTLRRVPRESVLMRAWGSRPKRSRSSVASAVSQVGYHGRQNASISPMVRFDGMRWFSET